MENLDSYLAYEYLDITSGSIYSEDLEMTFVQNDLEWLPTMEQYIEALKWMTGWIKEKAVLQEGPINAQVELHVARIQTLIMFVEGITNCLYEFNIKFYISFLNWNISKLCL